MLSLILTSLHKDRLPSICVAGSKGSIGDKDPVFEAISLCVCVCRGEPCQGRLGTG
jgi:hypothetical protein